MIALIQTILILLAITFWLFRTEKVVVSYLNRYQAPADKDASDVVKGEGMPDDILAFCNAYAEDWAKQQTSEAAWELYSKLKDWQKVRQALGFSSGTI